MQKFELTTEPETVAKQEAGGSRSAATCSPSSLTPLTDAFFERHDRRAGHWVIEPLEAHARWLESLMVRLYNQGYHAGHEDTVEACFTPIHHTDMDTYHSDVVAEILQENADVEARDQ
jgi:hypothetical protein